MSREDPGVSGAEAETSRMAAARRWADAVERLRVAPGSTTWLMSKVWAEKVRRCGHALWQKLGPPGTRTCVRSQCGWWTTARGTEATRTEATGGSAGVWVSPRRWRRARMCGQVGWSRCRGAEGESAFDAICSGRMQARAPEDSWRILPLLHQMRSQIARGAGSGRQPLYRTSRRFSSAAAL
jgi:hypothetical protein